jgi:hypothetical protein
MAETSAGQIQPQASLSPDSGKTSFLSGWSGPKRWNFLPLAPGVFGAFFAYNAYPLVAGRYLLIGIAFLPFLLVSLMPRTAVYSGVALALLAAGLWLNGALDRVPPAYVKATVIQKMSFPGDRRRGAHYDVIVSSWRTGRSTEDFDVDLGLFRRTVPGKTITVEVHEGAFRLPWYGNISPE